MSTYLNIEHAYVFNHLVLQNFKEQSFEKQDDDITLLHS